MAFPNLVLRAGGTLTAEATGIPVNGNNSFSVGISAQKLNNASQWLDVAVLPNGISVSGATFVSLVGNVITYNFAQSGVDSATVIATLKWSGER